MVLQAAKKFRRRNLGCGHLRIWWCISLVVLCCCSRPPMPPGTSWNQRSGVFRWWGGEVTLPVGLSYQLDGGDTFAGHFTSPDGKLIIHYDIGGYAGAFAHAKGSTTFEERIVEGARVWIAQQRWPTRARGSIRFALTFPDNGCANFYLYSDNMNDEAIISGVARSFRPKATSVVASPCGSRAPRP